MAYRETCSSPVLVVLGAVACLAGCSEDSKPDCGPLCSAEMPACPSGYECNAEGVCQRQGLGWKCQRRAQDAATAEEVLDGGGQEDGAATDAQQDGCTRTTCSAEATSCGFIDDGCGGEIKCGSCNEPESCIGGTCQVPPSCVGLAEICGPAGDASCCAATNVEGGTFDRSNDPSYPATLSDFRLETFEVTVGRFRKFVEAGRGTQASPPVAGAEAHPNAELVGSGWDPAWDAELAVNSDALRQALHCAMNFPTWTDTPESNETRPINCVTWYEAVAFCIWDGGWLPTEAELSYAAAGGDEQRYFPWGPLGTGLDPSYASYACLADGSADGCTPSDIRNVGSYSPAGDGRWGQSDLGGNVEEWVLDWYWSRYQMPCNDCANLTSGSQRLVRGGDFRDDGGALAVASFRTAYPPTHRSQRRGIRCARIPL